MTDSPNNEERRGVDRRVVLLQELARRRVEVIQPERDVTSLIGYSYPAARTVFDSRPGEEVGHLEDMAELGLLERTFFDKVHVCNSCRHYALNFREICPTCTSANIDIVDMIHHYRCGFNAPETQFRDGVRYVCPKCEQPLRHIGVDYERPASNYVCGACTYLFTEPKVEAVCLNCGVTVAAENTSLRTVYEYRVTTKGVLVASKGILESSEGRAVIDPDMGIYRIAYFEERLGQELARARRHQRSLVVLAAGLDQFRQLRGRHGEPAVARRNKELADLARESLRESDCAAFRDDVLLVMLTDTPVAGGYVVAERILGDISRRPSSAGLPPCTVSIGLASDADGREITPSQLIDTAAERLAQARESGGNSVWPRRP